jgi:HK97 family phage portal protein
MPSFMDRIPRPQAINTEMERLIREHFSGGGSSYSGVAVNSESAMRMMTVNNCVKVLFNCVSQMPCQLMEDVNDVKNKAKDHYLYKIISKRPNRWMTAPQLWGMAIVHVSLRGNFIAFKTGRPGSYKEILPVHPDRLQEIRQNPDWSLTYKITNAVGGGYQEYTQDQIFHIRGLSLDGFTGMNPIQYARECIGLGIASERFLANYFGKGLHPGAIIERPEKMDTADRKNMLEAYKIAYSGLGKSSDLMLLDGGAKIDFPPIKLVDAQFIEQMRFTEAQICGLFGVPLILVQAGSTPATFASSLQFKQSFVDFTIAPIAVNFETSIDKDFLTDVEQDTYYTKFNLNSLLRGNMAERFAAYAVGITNKFMNSNEARALEDWNKREGGDVYENPNTSSNKESDKQISKEEE